MEKEVRLKDIPTNYFMSSMWALFFILLFALLGANFYAAMEVRDVCGAALRGDVFKMCSSGCAEIRAQLDPKLFVGEVEWGLGCEVPDYILEQWKEPRATGVRVPPQDIKESYMNTTS